MKKTLTEQRIYNLVRVYEKNSICLLLPVLFLVLIGKMTAQTLEYPHIFHIEYSTEGQTLEYPHMIEYPTEKIDSFVKLYGEEKFLEILVNYRLKDTIVMLEGMWYNHVAFHNQPKSDNQKRTLTSLKMKAIYWSWLLYLDSLDWEPIENEEYHYLPVIVDICNVDTLGSYSDFYDLCDNRFSSRSHYKKFDSYWVDDIYNYFEAWGILLKNKGLRCLREKKLSPLNSKYKFVVRQIARAGLK
jgi:hypothetical protein